MNSNYSLLFLSLLYFIFLFIQKRNLLLIAFVVFCFSCVFYYFIDLNNATTLSVDDGKQLVGTIFSVVERDGDRVTFTLRTENKEKLITHYYLNSEHEIDEVTKYTPGLKCYFTGQLKEPSLPTNPHSFNYKQYLYYQKVHWMYELTKLPDKCVVKKSLNLKLQQFRQEGIDRVSNFISAPTNSFVIALIFGERKYIDQNLINSYQKLGIVHLLAISGLHVGVLTGFLYFIGLRIGVHKERLILLLLLFLPIYVIIAGAAPSVIRASSMTGFALFLLLKKKRLLAIDAIGLACIILLIINPYYLFQLGFQLSFVVSFFLILSQKILQARKSSFYRIFIVTVVAQLASFPIIIYHFYEFSLWSIVLNIIFVPFFSLFLLPLSLFLFILSYLSPSLVTLVTTIIDLPLHFLNNLAMLVADIPFGHILFGKPNVFVVILYFIVIFVLLIEMERSNLKRINFCLFLFVVLCFGQFYSGYFTSYGKVFVIDIGQGTSIFIQLPFGKGTYLLDTGGEIPFPKESWRTRRKEYHSGVDTLIPILKAEGVRAIDKLIISHGHFDHLGNTDAIIEEIKIKEVLVPFMFGKDELEVNFISRIEEKNIHLRYVKSGDSWDSGRFRVLLPFTEYDNKNNNSIVLLSTIGGKTWLFTGDIEKEAERNFVELFPSLEVDVLLVAHHGSSTSTTEAFLDLINPKVSIIPVGRNNRYGHPDTEVLNKLVERNIKVYRTDEDGAIIYRFRRQSGTFSTVLP